MEEYSLYRAHLEHRGVDQFLASKIEGLAQEIQGLEDLVQLHHPGARLNADFHGAIRLTHTDLVQMLPDWRQGPATVQRDSLGP
jgi:hypothetical protein